MNTARLLNRTGTLTTVTTGDDRDEFNNPTEVATTTTVKCWAEQLQAEEDTDDTNQQTDRWRIVIEPSAVATGWDRLEVDGMAFSFDGPPWPARNPRTSALEHIEAVGIRVQ